MSYRAASDDDGFRASLRGGGDGGGGRPEWRGTTDDDASRGYYEAMRSELGKPDYDAEAVDSFYSAAAAGRASSRGSARAGSARSRGSRPSVSRESRGSWREPRKSESTPFRDEDVEATFDDELMRAMAKAAAEEPAARPPRPSEYRTSSSRSSSRGSARHGSARSSRRARTPLDDYAASRASSARVSTPAGKPQLRLLRRKLRRSSTRGSARARRASGGVAASAASAASRRDDWTDATPPARRAATARSPPPASRGVRNSVARRSPYRAETPPETYTVSDEPREKRRASARGDAPPRRSSRPSAAAAASAVECTRKAGCPCADCRMAEEAMRTGVPVVTAAESKPKVRCDCGRSFEPSAFEAHQAACRKVFQSKRRAFKVKRVDEKVPASARRGAKKKPKKPNKWKAKSNYFRDAIRAAKQMDAIAKKGGDIRDVPMMPSAPDPDLVPCPHCGRTFNETAAERHIPRCKDIKAKPKRLVRKSTGVTSAAARRGRGTRRRRK